MNYATREHVDLHVIDAIDSAWLRDHGSECEALRDALVDTPLSIVCHSANSADSLAHVIEEIKVYRPSYIQPRHAVPYIHISCHGEKEGLVVGESKKIIEWAVLSEILLPLLEATDYHLALSFSSCWGYHGASLAYVMSKHYGKRRPYYSLVGPPDKEDGPALASAFAEFYRQLLVKFNNLKKSVKSANQLGQPKLGYTYGAHLAHRLREGLTGN